MKSGLVLLAICAVTIAMVVPRERRAQNSEENLSTDPTTTAKPKEICAYRTPCAWSTYKPGNKIILVNITNTYCECSPDTECQVNEDDSSISTYVYRCRPHVNEDEEAVAES